MPLRATTAAEYRERIARAQALLEARLDEELSPALLAREACFSLHHFHRIFVAQTGESVMQQVRRLRLERAARRLLAGRARLLELALEAGYGSHEAFTRAFTEHFGTLPSAFRAERLPLRSSPAPRAPRVTVRVEDFPALRVAGMRARGSYANVGGTWQQLVAWAQRHRLLRDTPCLYGLCPDDPAVTDEALLRFDACVLLDGALPDGGATLLEVPAGTYAVALHVGPYERLHETYLELIGHWLPTSGREPAVEAVVEHYLDMPSTTAPEHLRTEVRVRLSA